MSLETAAPPEKLPLVKLAIVAALLCVVGFIVLREIGAARLIELLDLLIAKIRDMGPWVFFAAMTVLPAMGAPMLAFSLVAGEAFGAQMTMPGVIITVALSIAANLALTYWLARHALRPVLTRLVQRY